MRRFFRPRAQGRLYEPLCADARGPSVVRTPLYGLLSERSFGGVPGALLRLPGPPAQPYGQLARHGDGPAEFLVEEDEVTGDHRQGEASQTHAHRDSEVEADRHRGGPGTQRRYQHAHGEIDQEEDGDV